MNNVVCSDTKLIKTVFMTLGKICEEITLIFTPDEIRMGGMDRLRVLLMNVELKEILFDIYNITEESHISFSLPELNRILKSIHADDILSLSFDEEYLTIIGEGEYKKTYRIKLLPEEYTSPLATIEYPTDITLDLPIFSTCVKDVAIFAENIKLTLNQDYLLLDGVGLFSDVHIEIQHDNTVQDEYTSTFSIPELSKITSITTIIDETRLQLGNDMPVTFDMTGYDDDLHCQFILAPRIDDD